MRSSGSLHIVWSQDELHRHATRQRRVSRLIRGAIFGAIAALCLVLAFAVAGVVLVEQTVRPPRRPSPGEQRASAAGLGADGTTTTVSLLAHDGVLLRGGTFEPRLPARGTAIVLHGASGDRTAVLPLARLLLRHGYRVLTPDLRAHGSSGGTISTAGQLESVDLRAWTERVRQQHQDECVFAVGVSLGAAAIVRALDDEPYCAAIVEAPFSGLRSMMLFNAGELIRSPLWLRRFVLTPAVELGLAYASFRYGIRADVAAHGNARVPLLVIEDGNDDAEAREDAERLAHRAGGHATLWPVPDASHLGAWRAAPQEYPERIVTFLDGHR